jgi:hypothetical protein
MAVVVRISYRWKYKGGISGQGSNHECNDMDHARNLCRKVIREHRRFEQVMRENGIDPSLKKGRNHGSQVSYISVKPEGTKNGDVIDAWDPDHGWHKARVQSNGLAKAIREEEN